jgi:hypothetical protein
MDRDEALTYRLREQMLLALDSTAGEPLIPESLDDIIVDLVKKQAPLTAMLTVNQANGKTHEFNRLTGLPVARAEGENADTAGTNSSYQRDSVPLKIVRAKGSVSGFQQAASKKYINSFQTEIVNAAKSMGYSIEGYVLWGDAAADIYQYSGANKAIQSNRIEYGDTAELALLDEMIDPVEEKGALADKKVFILSPQMISRLSSLDPTIRKNIAAVEFAGGRRMHHYRDIPLLPSSYTRPVSKMADITLASGGPGGNMEPGGAYRYRVSAVTIFGEQWASDSKDITLTAGHTKCQVSWTPVANAILYRVYRTIEGGAEGEEKLVAVVPGCTYKSDGTPELPITAYIDANPDTVVEAASDYALVKDSEGGDEVIFLMNLDPDNSVEIEGLLNEQGEKMDALIQYIALAKTKDTDDFLLLSYHAPAWKGEMFNAMARRVRAV